MAGGTVQLLVSTDTEVDVIIGGDTPASGPLRVEPGEQQTDVAHVAQLVMLLMAR